jgi:hypothetical protein
MNLQVMGIVLAAWLAFFMGRSLAAQPEHGTRQAAGSIEFQYGLMPAALVARHAEEHPERKMHGGAPSRSNMHLVVALFDKQRGARVSDAEVEATVSLLGGGSQRKRLQPMTIADLPSYGEFFAMGVPGLYRIRFEARRPGEAGISYAEFEHRIAREGSSR